MARIIAARDCMVLLYTTGLYCLLSSDVNPPSCMILQEEQNVARALSSCRPNDVAQTAVNVRIRMGVFRTQARDGISHNRRRRLVFQFYVSKRS